MYRIREEKKRGTWTLPYGQTLKLIYLICTISYLHRWPSIARFAKSMILHPRESYILKQTVCLSVCLSIYRGLKTQITFKIVPLNSRAQKLFRTSITHFYFFTYRVPKAQKLFRTSITHFYFFTYRVPSPNAQASNYLLGCLRSKSRTVKKNLARARRCPGVWNCGSKY